MINAIAGIQSQLQQNIDQTASLPTSYNIMFISDMHLASTYPLVAQYAANFDVALIVNTGDESEFGTRAEMTPAYLGQLRALTKTTPMIWLAGNHDSPETVNVMRSIPGVTVVGTKTTGVGGSIAVTAQQLSIYGLTIGAMPDPRVYGGSADYGSNDGAVVRRLEHAAVDDAVKGASPTEQFDIFATHEPVAADQLTKDLPGQIRQTNAGHLHAQNKDSKVQHDGRIDPFALAKRGDELTAASTSSRVQPVQAVSTTSTVTPRNPRSSSASNRSPRTVSSRRSSVSNLSVRCRARRTPRRRPASRSPHRRCT